MQDFFERFVLLVSSLLIFYGACATVQLTTVRPKTRYVVIGSFFALAVLVGMYGLLLLVSPQVLGSNEASAFQIALSCLLFAGVTILPLIKSIRVLLSRFTPVDPNSTVDISGVVVASWFIVIQGTYLVALNLDTIVDQVQVTVIQSVTDVMAYPVLAFSLVGVWVVRKPWEAVKRLGLERLTRRQVALSLALVAPLVLVAVAADLIGRQVQPNEYAQLEAILESMSSNVTSPVMALFLGFAAGIGEEVLFRGAIQPRLGIAFTAVLFAVAHTQYGLTFATLAVLIIGVVLGYQRKRMNTTSCIITHGAYNTIAFLISYFAGIGSGS